MLSKNYVRRGAPVFIGVYACALALSYLTYLLYYEFGEKGIGVEVVNYFTAFFMDAASFIMPMLLSALMLAVYERMGMRYALIRSAIITLPVAFYTLVSEYINQTMRGGVFTEALLVGALWAFAAALAFYAEGVVVFLITKWLSGRFSGDADAGGMFNFSSPLVRSVFIVCFVKFCIMLGIEIYTAASYLMDFAGTYLVSEIIYMTVRFLFVFGELFACHVLTIILKKRISDSFQQ